MLASFETELRNTTGILTECVILLNGCTDESRAIASHWKERLEVLGVKMTCLENIPALATMDSYIRAVSLATNKYAWLFGDDDVVEKGALRCIDQVLSGNPDLGLIALNWQSVEYDLATAVGLPRLPSGSGGIYDSCLSFARVAGIMSLSFLGAIVVKADLFLRTETVTNRRHFETNYPQLCALIEGCGSEPTYAIEQVCVLNRLNYRLDQSTRTEGHLAVQARASVESGLALVRALEAIGCPKDLVRSYKRNNTNHIRYAWFLLLLRATMTAADWDRLARELISTYSESWMVVIAIKTGCFMPKSLVRWVSSSRNRLRRIHRLSERLVVTTMSLKRSLLKAER